MQIGRKTPDLDRMVLKLAPCKLDKASFWEKGELDTQVHLKQRQKSQEFAEKHESIGPAKSQYGCFFPANLCRRRWKEV